MSLASCGKKGPPAAPLRISPGPVEMHVSRTQERVEVRVVPPSANQDKTTPSIAERVEIYAMTTPAGQPAPDAAVLVDGKHLVHSARIEPLTSRPSERNAAGPLPPGAPVVYVDKAAMAILAKTDAPTRHYLAIAVSGRRRGRPSPVVSVPLSAASDKPQPPTITYTERALVIQPPPPRADEAFHVDEVIPPLAEERETRKRLSTQPVTAAAALSVPAEFGRRRCFVVVSVTMTKTATIEGAASDPACETPVDRFGPPAPERLVGNPGTTDIDLSWAPVDAADLAGYVVLRDDGAGGTLQRLMATPITETSFRDAAVKSGVTYVYTVIALDKSGNAGLQSNQAVVTAR